MIKFSNVLFLSLCFFAANAYAETCIDLKTCAKLMNDLDGQRYIWDAKMDETKFVGSPDVRMTKETADLVFTALLDQLGFARAPVGDGKTYRVVRSQQRREMEMPELEASLDKAPVFPANSWDWVTMRYQLKYPECATYIESAYHSSVSRESRLLADENAGVILVTGPMPVVRQMYETLRGADRPLSAAVKERRKQQEKRYLAQLGQLGQTANARK